MPIQSTESRQYYTPVFARKNSKSRLQKKRQTIRATTSVAKVERQVKSIQKAIQPLKKNVIYYRMFANDNVGNATANNTYIYPLCKFSNWARTFGGDLDDESSKAFQLKSLQFSGILETSGERAALDYSMFVVRLKNMGESELFNISTGTLNTLVYDAHFTYGTTPGQGTYLNPNYFDIVYYKRFITGTAGSLTTNMTDLRRIFNFKLPASRLFTCKNPNGDWKAMGTPKAIGQNYFLLIQNNDSTADSAVKWTMNGLVTGVTVS